MVTAVLVVIKYIIGLHYGLQHFMCEFARTHWDVCCHLTPTSTFNSTSIEFDMTLKTVNISTLFKGRKKTANVV